MTDPYADEFQRFIPLPAISFPSNAPRRFWKGTDGSATYSVVAPNAVLAMVAILTSAYNSGCTDDIDELRVYEIFADVAKTKTIRGDGVPCISFFDMPMGDVACSEW